MLTIERLSTSIGFCGKSTSATRVPLGAIAREIQAQLSL
jgi:hypothetical protein